MAAPLGEDYPYEEWVCDEIVVTQIQAIRNNRTLSNGEIAKAVYDHLLNEGVIRSEEEFYSE